MKVKINNLPSLCEWILTKRFLNWYIINKHRGGSIMKKWFMVSMIIAILIASGCVSDKTAQNTENIKIGVLITYTGGLGPIGEGMANGAKLAAMEINNKGIIKGRNVTLIIED